MIHPYDVLSHMIEHFNDTEGVVFVTNEMHSEVPRELESLASLGYIRHIDSKSKTNMVAFDITDNGWRAYDTPSVFFTDMEKSKVWNADLVEEQAKTLVENAKFVTHDSGKRIEFPTGSVRDTNEGKSRFDLIGIWMLVRLAALLDRGAKKYSEHNWKKGQPISRSYESMFRHMIEWRTGMRDEDHLAAVVFNAMSIMHVEEEAKAGRLPKELLDLEFTKG